MEARKCHEYNALQLLCSWTLPIVKLLRVFKTQDISETGFCFRFQAQPTQMGQIDRASPYLRIPAPTQDKDT
jgi:hypothetical protein